MSTPHDRKLLRLHIRSRNKAYTWILIAVCIGSVTLSLFIAPVRADSLTVMVSRSSGSTGMTVTVHGKNATADGEVLVYFSSFFIGFFVATDRANSTGEYSVNISVPAFPAGSYSILVRDVTTGDTASAPFVIEAKIIVTPEKGSCNDRVTVEGHGFSSGNPITLIFDGQNVTTSPPPRTDDLGSFEAEFIVPKTPEGTHTVNASDGTNYASASFTVIPKIVLYPTSGPVSTAVFVNGTGFAPGATVAITFDSINVTMFPALPVGSDGSFMQLFFVPEMANGSYQVKASDDDGNSAGAPFLVPSPTLTLKPSTASGSSIITAEGSGFPPNQPVLLYLEGNLMVNLADLMGSSSTLTADEYGTYEYSFVVPVAEPGVYLVAAYSMTGRGLIGDELASVSLTIVEEATLVEIRDMMATIVVPDLGVIKENLTEIDAKLVGIQGNMATINSTLGQIQTDIDDINLNVTMIRGDLATIQTTLGTIEGKIVSIDEDTATIKTDIGTVKTDMLNIKKSQENFTVPLYVSLASALIAAIGAIFLTIIHIQAMRKTG